MNYCLNIPKPKCNSDILIGPQGNRGDVGQIGAQGPKGNDGFTGNEGKQGKIGPQGVQGITGPIGLTGESPKGETGPMPFFNLGGTYWGDYLYWNNNIVPPFWDIGSSKINIGRNAGKFNQQTFGIGIGQESANTNQKEKTVAIGIGAGFTGQKSNAIAIGRNAGRNAQGENCIAIGNFAGIDQSANSIILNASGSNLNAKNQGFFVNPIRSKNLTSNIYPLYYDVTNSEIRYDIFSTGIHGQVIVDISNTNVLIPSYVKRAFISGVGGGGAGAGSIRFTVDFNNGSGGAGGGSGGAIYKYPINIYQPTFDIVIGNGGIGGTYGNAGGDGTTTIITYFTNPTDKVSIYLGGGGGGSTPNVSAVRYGGAGGSVSFSSNDIINAVNNNSPSINTTSPFQSAFRNSGFASNGLEGIMINPIILGSSGGDQKTFSGNGFIGGNCVNSFNGGLAGAGSSGVITAGGAGGAGSIFANGGDGGGFLLAQNGLYGSGGGGSGGSNFDSKAGNGGNGRVVIEW
jgi:hypothetical protein